MVFETARFFAGRVTWNAEAQRYELRDIGCPDQYHTFADNNVFISRMAKWNLAYAAELADDARLRPVREKIGLSATEVAAVPHHRRTVLLSSHRMPRASSKSSTGSSRSPPICAASARAIVAHTQAVKQPDVLLLFHPFAEEYQRRGHAAQLALLRGAYLARLVAKPARHGVGRSQAGLLDEALRYFQRAARMDLDDINLNTNLGVHLAGYAVLWQTVVFGFGGLIPRRDGLHFRPRLPRQWDRLSVYTSIGTAIASSPTSRTSNYYSPPPRRTPHPSRYAWRRHPMRWCREKRGRCNYWDRRRPRLPILVPVRKKQRQVIHSLQSGVFFIHYRVVTGRCFLLPGTNIGRQDACDPQ